jgi:hypothetical protein
MLYPLSYEGQATPVRVPTSSDSSATRRFSHIVIGVWGEDCHVLRRE